MFTPEELDKAMSALARFSPLVEGAHAMKDRPPMAVLKPLLDAIGYINAAWAAAQPYEAWQQKPTPKGMKKSS